MSRTQIFNLTDLTPLLLQETARALAKGAVAVLPTDTVYGIATGAFCETSIARICQLKKRSEQQPMQLLMGSTAQVSRVAKLSPAALALAKTYWPGALTLILPPSDLGQTLLRGFEGLGIRVPAFAFLQQLLTVVDGPLACTSANEHGQAVLTDEQDLVQLFDGKVDFIFKAGRLSAMASSVVDLTKAPRLLREGAIPKAALERVMGEKFIS